MKLYRPWYSSLRNGPARGPLFFEQAVAVRFLDEEGVLGDRNYQTWIEVETVYDSPEDYRKAQAQKSMESALRKISKEECNLMGL